MATSKSREFLIYGDHCSSITVNAPIPGTQDSKNPANPILRAIIGAIAKHSAGLAECLEHSLELDGSAYTIHIVGTPQQLSRVDGTHCGHSFYITVFPRLAVRDNEEDGGLVDDDGYRD